MIVASAGGRMVEKLSAAGIEHYTLGLNTKNPLNIIANIVDLKKLCKEHNVGIVHARSRAPAWSAFFAARSLKIPFITSFHGFYKNNFPLKKYYNAIMAKGDTVIAVSNFIREHILATYSVDPAKIKLIHRGVDINEFDPAKIPAEEINSYRSINNLPANTPLILLPGRITRWKGHEVAVKAAHILKDKNFIIAFAGAVDENNSYYQELKNLISSLGLENKIRFLGDVRNMPLALMASDIVLSTSIEPETFGRVTAEAGAMGKIAISSAHGGSLEIIEDGKTGFLVEPNSEEALAVKISEVLDLSDEKAKAIGQAAQNRIKADFSLSQMCENTLNIYKQYLGPTIK